MKLNRTIRPAISGIPRVPIERAPKIVEAGHDPISGIVEVKFATGAVWQYPKVYSETFRAWLNADDQAAFFREFISSRSHAQQHVCVTQHEAEG